uniref:Periphilin 1 n=1 Tax=Cynoglossus semilaevis TaxID=244447 RepID=A0A3P8VPW3_CYNSE
VTYRRERGIREMYDDRFLNDRQRPYARGGHVDRRPPFPRQEEDYGRYDFDGGLRFYPNGGGPRNYHDDGRGYHGDNAHFSNERRGGPPSRRSFHRGPTFRARNARGPPPHNVRGQGLYPAPRSLPESGEDSLVQAILNLDRGEDRDHYRRKAGPFPSLRERSPVRREAARSPHSRSGSSVSSRGYSPDRTKPLPFPSMERLFTKLSLICPCPVYAQMYRQDCETFGIVVKMLVAKDPNLEKQLQVPLRENLGEIRERCLEELKLFINQLDSVVRQPETSICDSNTPSTSSLTGHKLSKTTVNHRSSY